MGVEALPCIKCGIGLLNVSEYVENQPDYGLAIWTHGHYGSTVFDPEDGTYLEFNVCDECLATAGLQGRVLVGRDKRPVEIDGFGQVGWERVDRPTIPWHKDLPGFDRDDYVTFSTVEEALDYENNDRIYWSIKPSKLLGDVNA